jgi:predicted house-cleaning noncanonical NTP pyrophosphatase (MazG superfamily)
MRIEYAKLVRDRIPEIIRREGSQCEVVPLAEDDYRQALRDKLVEEAREAAEADPAHLLIELADLSEVMDALMASYSIAPEAVRAAQERRRVERGGFAQRLRLLWTSTDAQD